MMDSLKQQQLEWQNRLRIYSGECRTPFAAIEVVLLKATENSPLTLNDLWKWQQMLAPQIKKIPDDLLTSFLKKINQSIQSQKTPSQIVHFIADSLIEFQIVQPLSQMTQLLANYLALRFHIPVILFYQKENQTFQQALHDSLRMRLYLAEKIKECVYDATGRLFFIVRDYGDSAVYHSQAHEGEEIVEWHELNHAIDKWREDLSEKP